MSRRDGRCVDGAVDEYVDGDVDGDVGEKRSTSAGWTGMGVRALDWMDLDGSGCMGI